MVWKPSKKTVIISAVGTVIGGIFILKSTAGGKRADIEYSKFDKVAIVTGANSGIGKETVREFAKRSMRVTMACRDLEKCEEAREEIVLETGNKYIYCRLCDLASQKSIRHFVEQYKKENDRLDVLVNNAGVMQCPLSRTEEGIEMQLGVNYMGHFLLTNLLLDMLKANAPSRIVNVSSHGYRFAKINTEDLNSENKYDPLEAYQQSKLALILFTRELASRLEGTKVTVNVVHPGISDTNITRHMGLEKSLFTQIFGKPLLKVLMRTANQGAQTSVYVALEESLENVSGQLFDNCALTQVQSKPEYGKLGRWLWLVGEKWTGLS